MARLGAAKLIDRALLRRWTLPRLGEHADKVARGDVLVVAGSLELPGAALLAGTAVLRVGAGRVQLVVPRTLAPILAVAFPEARVIAGAQTRAGELAASCVHQVQKQLAACRSLLVGPGMSGPTVADRLLREVRRTGCTATAVLDAGALKLFATPAYRDGPRLPGVIATPHAGEMAQMCGCTLEDVRAAPLQLAKETARKLGVVLVLKGKRTLVVAPDGTAFQNVAGNVGLATAGSGDTLAGLIAGMAARGAAPLQAAVWGVHLHAKAGEACARSRGPLGYLARELAAEVPPLLAKYVRSRPATRSPRR
jgi:ADP-dependent NAD(P)H-hydrate dehydratase